MLVKNVHERQLAAPAEEVGALLDTLATAVDTLWPGQVAAKGGGIAEFSVTGTAVVPVGQVSALGNDHRQGLSPAITSLTKVWQLPV